MQTDQELVEEHVGNDGEECVINNMAIMLMLMLIIQIIQQVVDSQRS